VSWSKLLNSTLFHNVHDIRNGHSDGDADSAGNGAELYVQKEEAYC
jgi:hypothetical protein